MGIIQTIRESAEQRYGIKLIEEDAAKQKKAEKQEMREVICVHKWGSDVAVRDFKSGEWDIYTLRQCKRCWEWWRSGEKEPRVVIGRVE